MALGPIRLQIATSGIATPRDVVLEPEHAVIVGRSPERSTREATVAIPSPNVSGSHVKVEHRGDRAEVTDLGSRNGTWLELPPRCSVTVPLDGVDELALHLAPGFGAKPLGEPPVDARWTSEDDYAVALQRALADWFAIGGEPARIALATTSEHADRVGRMPLATGHDLVIEPLHTTGPSWLEALAIAERYVARQNVLFETEQSLRDDGWIVASSALRAAVAQVVDTAASGSRVLLLTGESGTGKEGLARCFHRRTGRAGPFIARNCALLGRELARTELFGAEKGAFTGSVQRIVGAVESANEGTLFLDELGELPRDVQPMLLRFLDHGEYERLGRGGVAARADVRIVCATNTDLRQAALADRFRTDLWFRLSVHVIDVPPLRERFEDVVAYLRARPHAGFGSVYEALGEETIAMLAAHPWPGNFRELVGFAARVELASPHAAIAPELARRALSEGSLVPIEPRPGPTPGPERAVPDQATQAAHAFVADRGSHPATWDDVKDFVENYLKPVLFADLAGASELASLADVEVRAAADRVRSDRGTATKQLRRYFDRYRRIDS